MKKLLLFVIWWIVLGMLWGFIIHNITYTPPEDKYYGTSYPELMELVDKSEVFMIAKNGEWFNLVKHRERMKNENLNMYNSH